MTHGGGKVAWYFWPFVALWRLLAFILTLTGRILGVVLGLVCAAPSCAAEPADPSLPAIEIRRAETVAADGLIEATVGADRKIYLHKTPEAGSKDIVDVRVAPGPGGKPAIEITFSDEAAKKMGKVTQAHSDKPLAVLVCGKVLVAPTVRSAISKKAVISGDFTNEEAARMVKAIRGK